MRVILSLSLILTECHFILSDQQKESDSPTPPPLTRPTSSPLAPTPPRHEFNEVEHEHEPIIQDYSYSDYPPEEYAQADNYTELQMTIEIKPG